jgi:hypothetical protein
LQRNVVERELDVSQEYTASIFDVEDKASQETKRWSRQAELNL